MVCFHAASPSTLKANPIKSVAFPNHPPMCIHIISFLHYSSGVAPKPLTSNRNLQLMPSSEINLQIIRETGREGGRVFRCFCCTVRGCHIACCPKMLKTSGRASSNHDTIQIQIVLMDCFTTTTTKGPSILYAKCHISYASLRCRYRCTTSQPCRPSTTA